MRVEIFDILNNHFQFLNAKVELHENSGVLCVRDEGGILYNFLLKNLIYYTVQSDRQMKAKGGTGDAPYIQPTSVCSSPDIV